eukprot:TRINITY_DN669_c0_g1_i3.p1 TRINITY_DN669_c0_g1~~TRINITY_DN669_c0_g1_i3.p1  ORF type:complete len:713 (+),score=162.83 TRINITY_DN669_c0_g1_i3:300-2141(+)
MTAKIGDAKSKIEGLAVDISSASADLQGATSIREKERSDFEAGEKELLEVIDTLGRATTILEREMRKNPAAFAQVATSGLKGVMQALSSVADAAAFSSTDKNTLLTLVQSQQGSNTEDGDFGAPAADAYTSHSTNIIDVLEDLHEKAEQQLSELRKAEVNARHNFEMMKQSLVDQMSADQKETVDQKAAKSAAAQTKATAEGDLTVTTNDLKAAEEAMATAASTCEEAARNHEESLKARDEELKVIAEAVGVLKSTSSGAVKQTYSFFQAKSDSNIRSRADLLRSEVVTYIKNMAREQHSAVLAQLASRVEAVLRFGVSGDGPFAKVRGLIEDLISKLEAEASSDATEKSYCDDELAKTSAKKDELNAELAKLTSKIDQATSRSSELTQDIRECESDLATVAKEQAEMDTMRKTASADYVAAKRELEQGLSGVRKALMILRDYYAQKQGGDSFTQAPALPEKHEKATGAGTSIIGILEVVESDFATSLAKEETEEAEAQEAYDRMTQENKITKTTKESDVKYKTKELGSLTNTLAELRSDRESASTESDAILEYDSKLKKRCIAKPMTFEARKQRRESEIAGLKEALEILNSQSSLVQRHGHRVHKTHGFLSP